MPKVPQLVPVAKARQAGDDEDDGGQEIHEGCQRQRLHETSDKIFRRPGESVMDFRVQCEGQDEDGGDHGLKALRGCRPCTP